MNVNTRKALVACVSVFCLTLLLLFEKIDPATGGAGIVGICMYIIGNGVAAATGKDVEPIVRAKRRNNRTRHGDPDKEDS